MDMKSFVVGRREDKLLSQTPLVMVNLACNAFVLFLILVGACAQDYCRICRDHTMCKYWWFGPRCSRRVFWGVNDFATKQKILDLHNKYRSYVAQGKERRGAPGPQPPAANMNRLKWDDELSRVAQRWAEQCDFKHDACRNVERFGWVGQNLYKEALWKSNGVVPDDVQHWDVAIKAFYEEVVDLNKNNIDKFNSYPSRNQTGHYTQLVWGKTLLVGCGFISYWEWKDGKDWYHKYYACNYAPGGNVISQKVYEKGRACSKCPPDTICRDGLCTANFPTLISVVKNLFPNLYNLLRL